MRWILLLCIAILLQACVNHTKLAKEAVEADLPSIGKFDTRDVTFRSVENYPGEVVCGEYTTRKKRSENNYSRFIYTPSGLDRHPKKVDLSVFCNTDAQQGLYLSSGINYSGGTKAIVQRIRKDLNQVSVALQKYQADNLILPTSKQGLEALVHPSNIAPEPNAFLKGGYLKKVPIDPWGAPYIYAPPVFGGVEGNYELLTLGADKKVGGQNEDADVAWHHMKYIDHIDQLN